MAYKLDSGQRRIVALASPGSHRAEGGGLQPPPLKRARLCGPSELKQSESRADMQTASGNGTVVENGSTSNGVAPLANGCGGEVGREEESRTHRKRGLNLSETDSDIIRLIGQHLREMGLQ